MHTPPHPLVIAHRGASASAPDNTLQALALAVAADADGVELDVRRTADGVLVLSHDPVLDDGSAIIDTAFAELRMRSPLVPTLDEILLVTGDLMIDLEIKNAPGEPDHDPDDRVAVAVVEWIAANGIRGRVVVSSFNPVTLATVRRLDPHVVTGQLVAASPSLVETAAAVADAGHAWIVPHHSLIDDAVGLVDRVHDTGLYIMVWTVDDPARMRILAGAGIDGIITNDPALANATFQT